jgi:hypothetical protein
MLVPSGIHAKYRNLQNAESTCNPRFFRAFKPKITHSIPPRPNIRTPKLASLALGVGQAGQAQVHGQHLGTRELLRSFDRMLASPAARNRRSSAGSLL